MRVLNTTRAPVQMRVRMCVGVCAGVCVPVCVCRHTRTPTFSCLSTGVFPCLGARVRVCQHTRTHAHTRAHTRTHAHTRAHTRHPATHLSLHAPKSNTVCWVVLCGLGCSFLFRCSFRFCLSCPPCLPPSLSCGCLLPVRLSPFPPFTRSFAHTRSRALPVDVPWM